jgi:Ca-activated chloride channel family protein
LKLLSKRAPESALLIVSFLVLPLYAVSSGATNRTQQASTAAAAQATTTAGAPATRKLTVTVIGPNGGFLAGLTRDSFAVFEGKSQHKINYFDSADAPVSVGVLVDVSGSVRRRTVEAARRVALQFIEQSHPENEYFIGEFGNGLRGLIDWTRDRQAIAEGLSKLATGNGAKQKPEPKGQTPLYDSCVAALEKMASAAHPKRVILLIGDGGGDNDSKHSFADIRRRIRDSDVLMYAININIERNSSIPNIAAQAIFDELTNLSGGRAYFVDNEKDSTEATKRLAMELRHQYVIGFTPADARGERGGEWKKVKIKLTLPGTSTRNVFIRSREGYVSTPLPPRTDASSKPLPE